MSKQVMKIQHILLLAVTLVTTTTLALGPCDADLCACTVSSDSSLKMECPSWMQTTGPYYSELASANCAVDLPGNMGCVGINTMAFENVSYSSFACGTVNTTDGSGSYITSLQVKDGENGTLYLEYDLETPPPECSQADPGFSVPTESPTTAPTPPDSSSGTNTVKSVVGGIIIAVYFLTVLAL